MPPARMPMTPPRAQSATASSVNWKRIFFCVAPDGFAYANLARALGHAHQHDIHHAHPADHQAYARDREQKNKQSAGKRIPKIEQRVGGKDDEVIRLVGVKLAAAAQQFADFILDGKLVHWLSYFTLIQ